MRISILMITIVIVLIVSMFYTKEAHAANEYLNSGTSHCETATLEPYAEIGEQDGTSGNTYPNSDNNNYKGTNSGSNWRVGIRLRIALGSTCNAEYKRIMRTNALLKQQLEMLKMCARYKGLDLGPEFSEVKRMCAGVNKKPTEAKAPTVDETILEAKKVIDRIENQ
tara:strand:- start:75 stop:575 length:501 start_codon:yes stop_codon:yes gene_type:complete